MKRIKKMVNGYKLVNAGYNNKVYKNGVLVAEFTDTIVGAVNYINKLAK